MLIICKTPLFSNCIYIRIIRYFFKLSRIISFFLYFSLIYIYCIRDRMWLSVRVKKELPVTRQLSIKYSSLYFIELLK